MVDLILDVFKYQIIRSVGKTSIRRKIERKLKKKKVFEIPNLIDLLDIRNLLKAKFFVTRKKLDEKDEEDIIMDYLSPVGSFFSNWIFTKTRNQMRYEKMHDQSRLKK